MMFDTLIQAMFCVLNDFVWQNNALGVDDSNFLIK